MSDLPKFISYLQDEIKTMQQIIALDSVDADPRMIVRCHKHKMLLGFLMNMSDTPKHTTARGMERSGYTLRGDVKDALCEVVNGSEVPLKVDTIVSRIQNKLNRPITKRVVQYVLQTYTVEGKIKRVSYGIYAGLSA